ncbi:adenylate/guanylate cyclase domain-containing protein [Dongia deserti]|uniref:adenylate/guanylate cyclase domain-containing protein n=1 Tax=Dongia deserti TaxID=2268030 RepID=UPI0025485313|nr:adenylate/guanylate cyclase domain-containing protein [Dongia deserti]
MPPTTGHWGRIIAVTRLTTGLILFLYVLTHNLNHALGLVSLAAMEAGRLVFLGFWRPLEPILLLAALLHLSIGLRALYRRKSLRMPRLEASQLVLGLSAPPLIILHILGTAVAHALYGVDDRYAYVLWAAWTAAPINGVLQSSALVVTWIHGCIGLSYWLRVKAWFPPWRPWLGALALLIPVLALLGFVAGAREVAALAADPNWPAILDAKINLPAQDQVAFLDEVGDWLLLGFAAIVAGVFAGRGVRALATRRRAITVSYPNGKRVVIQPGTSLLEASRIGGIPHASVCGGRSRCSTCRVRVIEGVDLLPPPQEEEDRVLARIHAPPGVRLACQTRPTAPVTIQPLLSPEITAPKALFRGDLSQGKEQEVAILFADLRGFTSMAERRLPYDVVFLLNQYFRLMGEAILAAGGHVDKFIGDGVMAVFGLKGRPELASAQALDAARRMATALEIFNVQHRAELKAPFRIGIGIHFGPAIVGEMGFPPALSLTAIGDTVNTASRLETATKEENCQLLISEIVAHGAELPVDMGRRCEIILRGREQTLIAIAIDDAATVPVSA